MTMAASSACGRACATRAGSRRRDPSILDSGYSPVPDLAKYECPESDDAYRHRMMMNAIAFVFTSVLVLVGVWLANTMMVHA
jgi:hypothetical protein